MKLDFELALRCNVCGSTQSATISGTDRYGIPVRSAMCLACGLIYLVDRFTARGYAEFYGSGSYRSLVSRFKAKPQPVSAIRSGQVEYARALARTLAGRLPGSRGHRLLDVGGSTGLVAREFVERYGFEATLLDPSPEEAAAAGALGISAIVGSIESWDTDERFDLVLLCRAFEHLHDLRTAFSAVRRLLKPGGLLYCDIADFLEICRCEGPPQATTKIDHCYWLSQEAAPVVFGNLGFEVASTFAAIASDQVGFLLRPATRASSETPAGLIERQLRRLREIDSDWHEYGRRPSSGLERLRMSAYHLKKRIALAKPWVARRSSDLLGGRIVAYEMDRLHPLPLDGQSAPDLRPDSAPLAGAGRLGTTRVPDDALARVRLLVLDFDGVMTDNLVLVDQDGKESVSCNRGDGLGIQRLRESGLEALVLSTETNPVVAARCRKLQIDCLHGCGDKVSALRQIARQRSLDADEIAYVGNDVNDLECMRWVGVPIAVQDATPEVKRVATAVTTSRGGQGAVREVADWIIQSKERALAG